MRAVAYSLCLLVATLLALSVPAIVHAPPPDTIPPVIGTPTIQPSVPTSSQPVTVSVNVTDDRAVMNVTIVYTTDNWKTVNTTIVASYNITSSFAKVQIPAQTNGGHVAFYVVAFDTAGLRTVNNNSGNYFTYNVPAPNTTNYWIITAAIAGALGAFAIIFVRTVIKRPSSSPSRTS